MKITYLLTTSKAHIVLIESVLMPLVPTLGVLGTDVYVKFVHSRDVTDLGL